MRNHLPVGLALLLLVAACTSPSGTVGPSAVPSPTDAPADSPPASSEAPSAWPTDDLPAFVCSLPITGAATIGIAHTTDVRVGTHAGYDRIVFEFAEDGTPEFRIEATSPPYTRDPSDLPMAVNGSSVVQVILNGGTKMADDGSSTYTGPTEFEPGFPAIAHLVERGDFEAVSSWYLGLNDGECLRAVVLSAPSRIVIDVEH